MALSWVIEERPYNRSGSYVPQLALRRGPALRWGPGSLGGLSMVGSGMLNSREMVGAERRGLDHVLGPSIK